MADNVSITSGSGTVIATDDVLGVNYQQVKLVDGTLDSTTVIAAGGGVEAGALRVTIASDSTGVVSVDDNGASLTVDGTVTANAGTGNFTVTQATAANLNATVTGFTSAGAAAFTKLTDGLTTAGLAGTSLSIAGFASAGTAAFARITDGVTSAGLAGTSQVVTGFASAGTAAFARITDGVTSAGLAGTSQVVTGFASAGTAAFAKITDGLTTAGLAGTSQVVTGFASAGTAAYARITDGVTSAGLAGTSQVVTGFTTTTNFAYVRLTDGTNVASVGANGGVEITGGTIHGTTDLGNPIKLGAKAEASVTSSPNVNDGYRTDIYADLDGVLLTKPLVPYGDILSQRTFDSTGTSIALTTFGASAGLRNYLTQITVYNSSTTNGYIDFRDGTTGTVIYTVPLPALGGANINFTLPLRQPTASQALCYDVSSAIASTIISVIGFKAF
jgi:hypothetical protein